MPDIIYTKSHVLNFTLILIYISHHTVNIPSPIPSLFTDATIYVHEEEIENEKINLNRVLLQAIEAVYTQLSWHQRPTDFYNRYNCVTYFPSRAWTPLAKILTIRQNYKIRSVSRKYWLSSEWNSITTCWVKIYFQLNCRLQWYHSFKPPQQAMHQTEI